MKLRTAYLDHNATTLVRPAALAAMTEALAAVGNPSSVHRFGRLARRRLDEAREQVAALVGAAAEAVLFTSGGTEANALALRGTGRERVLVSAIEHDSVRRAMASVETIPVDGQGRVDPAVVAAMLEADDRPALVSVMLANNETGVIQPVAEIARIARRYGALVHCDAVQAAGKVPVDMAALGVDLLTLSAHKLGGPQGVGALVAAESVTDLMPLLTGGGQEGRKRAGTENVAGIAGFGAAAAEAAAGLAGVAALRDELEAEALAIAPGAEVHGAGADRLPNTCCLSLPGLSAEVQVMALDLAGVAVSAGAACSSGKVAASHVLTAMGVAAERTGSAIRVSLGWNTTRDDVAQFVEAWGALARRAATRDVAASAA